jgi:exosortase
MRPLDSTAGIRMAKKQIILFGILLASFAILYRNVIVKLVHDWSVDENYSHGYLVVPVVVYFVWDRRERLLNSSRSPSWLGLPIVLASIGLLLGGMLGAEVFTTEISMLGVISGIVLYLCGWGHLKALLFPILFLISMIPLPAIIFNQITFPLQILASQFGELVLMTLQIPVLREGNVIHLANTSLEVAEACSGIRSLITLTSLGIVSGYFIDNRGWVRTALAFTTVPVAIVANGLRVAGTGVAAQLYGASIALGFFHEFSGWLVFVTAFIMLLILYKVMVWGFPRRTKSVEPPAEQMAAYSIKP